MIFAGIDAGSRAVKVVLLDAATRTPIAMESIDQSPRPGQCAEGFYRQLLAREGLGDGDVGCVVATGYARGTVASADTTITEITCHAAGVHHLAPEARTVIEIGGQDSKLLHLKPDGAVRDFAMNDRCAAGTGRFLELVSQRLDLPLSRLGALAARSVEPAIISSMCAIFAETEIIGLLASGRPGEDIIAGVQSAIASRIASMAGRNVGTPVVFTGGVARVDGMDKALTNVLGQPVTVVPHAQFTGALGAALLAMRQGRELPGCER